MQMVRGATAAGEMMTSQRDGEGLPSRSRWTLTGEDEGDGEVRNAPPGNPNIDVR